MRGWIATFSLVAAAGCSSQLERVGGDDGGATTPCSVQAIFDSKCDGVACHNTGLAGGLSLAPGSDVIGAPASQGAAIVEIGNVEESYMAIKILPDAPGDIQRQGLPMPPESEEQLTADERAVIIGWIAGSPLPPCETGGPMTGGPMTGSGDGSSGDTGTPIMLCSVDDFPGTTPPEAADEAGMIPVEIGDALARSCGCHYTADVTIVYPYTGALDMSTHAGFQADNVPAPPAMPDMMPDYELVLARLTTAPASLRMPPPLFCNDGMDNAITQADADLLEAWLMADAPDGATWMGAN